MSGPSLCSHVGQSACGTRMFPVCAWGSDAKASCKHTFVGSEICWAKCDWAIAHKANSCKVLC
eukprot:7030772-Lingulodinium_polyedra.AAC.1